MPHPVLQPGAVAVVTGGASGIGQAAAAAFARLGLQVCVADMPGPALDQVPAGMMAHATDVRRQVDLKALRAAVLDRFGRVDVLMNNAAIQPGSDMFSPADAWTRILETNLWGVIHGSQIFAPGMIAAGRPGLIINTGSKQGITTPPGDPAYNVAKAGVKAFTEALQHTLRSTEGCQVTAHLLIPGFVFTPLTANGRTEKPGAAWTPEQTVDFMLGSLEAGDFYILCPDNDVPRALDERRILWAAGDIVENRPPLSRWHPDFADVAKRFMDNRETRPTYRLPHASEDSMTDRLSHPPLGAEGAQIKRDITEAKKRDGSKTEDFDLGAAMLGTDNEAGSAPDHDGMAEARNAPPPP